MYRKAICFIFTLALMLSFGSSWAAEKTTPKEAKAKAQQAVKMLQEKGKAALPLFQDKKGPFVWKDSYVLVSTAGGTILAHAYVPQLVGKNIARGRDAKGNYFYPLVINATQKTGAGWAEWWWKNPVSKKLELKASYCMRVPGKDMIVTAGVWGMTAAQAEAAAK